MISVIVTSYNIEQYVEDCLRSVMGQTLYDIEIIVVDDGSSDSTPEIISRLAEEDSRIKPVLLSDNTPGGVATGANIGISHAEGEYIGFVDGDDWCEPYMFEKLLGAMDSTGAEIAIGDFKNYDNVSASFYDPSDKRHWLKGIPVGTLLQGEGVAKSLLKFNPVPWRKLYRKGFLDENNIRFPEGDYFYEDNPFHWFCVTKADSFVLVSDCLCYHRMNREGQTMSTGDRRLLAMYEHHQTIFGWLKTTGLFDSYKEELVLWVVNNSCWIYDAIRDEFKLEVVNRLRDELSGYDVEFVKSVVTSENMGGKGRALSLEALGVEDKMSASNAPMSLVQEAWLYYQEHGVKQTCRKIVSYIFHRMPVPVKKMIGALRRNNVVGKSAKYSEELKQIRKQVEFSKLLVALSDEKIENLDYKLDKIGKDIEEIKSSLRDK